MAHRYTPVDKIKEGNYVILTGPGWPMAPSDGPVRGDIVKVEWVFDTAYGITPVFYHQGDPSRAYFINDEDRAAALVKV